MLNEHGHEVPDPRPVARPLHVDVPETLAEMIQRMVRSQVSRQAEAVGFETFEDADDFDVGDDEELSSPYELSDSNFEVDHGNERKPPGDDGPRAAGDAGGSGTAGQSVAAGGVTGQPGGGEAPPATEARR